MGIYKNLSLLTLTFTLASCLNNFGNARIIDEGGNTEISASFVIGQPDLETAIGGTTTSSSLNDPWGNVVVVSSKLYISDVSNHRVLGFNSVPTSNNPTADFVLGQDDFVTSTYHTSQSGFIAPLKVFSDGTRLGIVDNGNSRIILHGGAPSTNNPDASFVVGQSDFSSSGHACASNRFFFPQGAAMAADKLLVADSANSRVLIWNTIPTSNGVAADLVIGQADFVSCIPNQDSDPDADTMYTPTDVWTDGTRVVVVDAENQRVLIWNSFPTTNGQAADVVIGQSNFVSTEANAGGDVSASGLFDPYNVFVDTDGSLYVADYSNNRVLIWNTFPTSSGQAADAVLGQTDFVSSDSNLSASTMTGPGGIYSHDGKLFVTDSGNNRVLVFEK